VLAVVGVLVAALLTWASGARARSIRMCCVNSLKQTGLAFQVWSGDNHGDFPMGIPETNGGTKEFITGPNAYRHFQVVSNELTTLYTVICAADIRSERMATNFTYLNNSNISFFIGVDAHPTNGSRILAGDRNLTNGMSAHDAILDVTAKNPSGWTAELHGGVGNVLLSDSSVQQVSVAGLRETIAMTGLATNSLQMPVTIP